MKIFDVHTHVYPDKIAERAVDALGKFYDFVPEGDGTYGNMTDNDRKCGVNGFLLLCVATNAHQIRRVNESVAAAMERGGADGFEAYAFGGIHPCGDMKAEIRSAKSEDFSISYNQTIETDLLQTITVTGSSKNVQTEETGQGIEVRAEDLGTVEIELSRDGEDLDRSVVQASGDHLLIIVNNDEVTAMEDRNGDGKYETPAREAGAVQPLHRRQGGRLLL